MLINVKKMTGNFLVPTCLNARNNLIFRFFSYVLSGIVYSYDNSLVLIVIYAMKSNRIELTIFIFFFHTQI